MNQLVPGFCASREFQHLLLVTSPAEIIQRFYRVILGREPATNEISAWVNSLTPAVDWCSVATGFLESPEYVGGERSFADHVTVLYRAFLGRDPEPDGLAGWLRAVVNGVQSIQRGFTNSLEFCSVRIQDLFPR